VYTDQDLGSQIADLRSFISQNLRVELSLPAIDEKIKTKRKIQHFFEARFKDPEKQKLYEIILENMAKAESTCPGAGYEMLKKFCNVQNLDNNSKVKDKDGLFQEFRNKNISNLNCNLLHAALSMSSINSKIMIRKSSTSKSYVELTEGYNFHLKSLIKIPFLDVKDARVVCIDGYVESISEIHHLLEGLSENKAPCLIFSRGMSEDVLHTIKVNNDRGTIRLYPYLVPFDVENANTLVDIAVVAGTDLVSSLKGDLISSISFADLKKVDQAILLDEKIVINNPSTKNNVEIHIRNIRKKIEENKELTDLLTSRIKKLTSSFVEICIPDDMNFHSSSHQIDEGIRIFYSIMTSTYDVESVGSHYANSLNKIFSDLQ